jgi:1-acyl-sn-glycerol-3-phosphate acyltransferase
MLFLRSLAFNVALYVMTVVMILATWPVAFLASRETNIRLARTWARAIFFLMRTIAGIRIEVRGLDNIPEGGVVIASKHQSMFETFALFPYIDDLTVVMKRELMHIPFFGWYARRAGMIPVDRDRGPAALRSLSARVKAAIADGRRVLIFPEGTRRAPGAEPAYRTGIAHLYRALGVGVVPGALNSGVFWPRRKFLRRPGTIIVEFLPVIPPGAAPKAFLARLEQDIEGASARLLAEASRQDAGKGGEKLSSSAART